MVRRYASKVWTDTVPCSDHELKRPKRKGSQGNLSRTRFPRLQYQNTTDTKEPWTFNACVGYGATLYLQLTWGYVTVCDSFYGWDHHAAFPAMIDLIPCLRAFTDCLDNTTIRGKNATKGKMKRCDSSLRLDSQLVFNAFCGCACHLAHPFNVNPTPQHRSHTRQCRVVQTTSRHKEKHLNHLHQAILVRYCWQCDTIW